ncbi:MAG: GDSL-type esterase/lipase family protein [Bacteroidales bacterium]
MKFLKHKALLFISLGLNIVFLFLVFHYSINNRESLMQKWIEKKEKATIVMFGDSHTARPDWNVLLSRCDIKRSAYGGFTSEQLLFRIQSDVIRYQPKICFVQCGGNDINSACFSAEEVVRNLQQIINILQANKIVPVVQSLFHRNNNPEYNKKVEKLNDFIQELAMDKNVQYLNIDKFLIDKNGLKKDLTVDNIHLNAKGYDIWVGQLKAFLFEFE